MVYKKCPGQDMSRKSLEEIVCNLPCPKCGYTIEFFFDDKVRICPECGSRVEKSAEKILKDFGCADWCEAAEKCIGTKLYQQVKAAKQEKNGGKNEG